MSAATAAVQAPQRETHPGLVAISVMLATIMQALDTTIANVALPHMQGSLAATQDQISWVLTSYIVAAAITMPATGFIAAKIGRKRLLLISISGFIVTSMLCGIALSLEQIVLYRLLQGIFGASLVPLSQAVLLDAYPREKHGAAMAMWGVGVMVGPILGPTLGGYLTENFDWRWVFFINLPFGLLALAGAWAFVSESVRQTKLRFDAMGFLFLGVAIGALQMMLDRGELLDWFGSTEIIAEGLIAAVAFYLFVVHMFTFPKPFLEPRLFKDRNFVTGTSFMFVVGIILLATMALLPPMLQQLAGFPVITTGYVLAPRGIGTMISMFVVGRLVGKVDPRLLLAAGLAMAAFSLWEMTEFNIDVGTWDIVRTGIVQGAGLGLIFVPLSAITFSTLAADLRTEAAGLFSLMRNIGSSVGISIVTALLTRNTQINHSQMAEHITPYMQALQAPGYPAMWSFHTTEGLAALNEELTRQAQMVAYLNDFKLLMWVTLAAAPLILLLRKNMRAIPKEAMEAVE
ncbi:MAG TPA: DHA2 family efflux MFS transporter permease subunit [Dongiaceae bacterium]|jgi:DHA2 family multidrug resistance protein